MIRSCSLIFGFSVAAYGVIGIWLSNGSPDARLRQAFCEAWLCPLEFSPERLYELHSARQADNSSEPVAELKRALQQNSASAYAWADLGEVFASRGDRARAEYSMQRAVASGPNSPAILMRAANVGLSERDYSSTMIYLVRILQDPEAKQFYPAAFLTYSRIPFGLQYILDDRIPAKPGVADALLSYATSSPRNSDAAVAWNWIVKHGLATDNLARVYLTFLISHGCETAAADAWAALNTNTDLEYRRVNWVFNGGFEHAPRPVPLDWQIDQNGGVEVSRSNEPQQGRWSLRLSFAGTENVQFEGVRQQTMLPPGKWRASAAIRTEGITTDEGIAIRVFDPLQSRRLDVTTDGLTGTHGWTRVERVFEVKPETKVVGVQVFRRSSQRFDSKIAGLAWVDSVALIPAK